KTTSFFVVLRGQKIDERFRYRLKTGTLWTNCGRATRRPCRVAVVWLDGEVTPGVEYVCVGLLNYTAMLGPKLLECLDNLLKAEWMLNGCI
ncbi:MAG: hypothetical protein AAF304_07595, partial [Pseudomonadota bacterium]